MQSLFDTWLLVERCDYIRLSSWLHKNWLGHDWWWMERE